MFKNESPGNRIVRITVEILPENSDKAEMLASKVARYEVPITSSQAEWKRREPIRLQLISGEQELIFDTVCDD